MFNGFPTNTVFWIIVVMFGTGISAWVILSRGLRRLSLPQPVQRNWRWGTGIVLALWLLGRLAIAAFPPVSGAVAAQFAISFSLAGLGLLAGLLLLLISPTFRKIIRAVPQTWLVGVQAIRVGGFIFLALADMKLLPTGFALPAGYGDMLTGLLAIGMVGLLSQQKPYNRALAAAFNALGLLDLVSALTTGAIFLGTFAAHAAASGAALQYLNYVLLIPSFAVPIFALLHVYSLYRLRSVQESREEQESPYQPAQSPAR